MKVGGEVVRTDGRFFRTHRNQISPCSKHRQVAGRHRGQEDMTSLFRLPGIVMSCYLLGMHGHPTLLAVLRLLVCPCPHSELSHHALAQLHTYSTIVIQLLKQVGWAFVNTLCFLQHFACSFAHVHAWCCRIMRLHSCIRSRSPFSRVRSR